MTNLPGSVTKQDSLLLTTKLYIPRPRPNLVSRPRLIARLNQSLEHTLTVISAPAGFGKTTLLSEWLANLRFPNDDLRLDDEKIVYTQPPIPNPQYPTPNTQKAGTSKRGQASGHKQAGAGKRAQASRGRQAGSAQPPRLCPPGYGTGRKSKIQNPRFAWLSLDENDNDLARFLSYLIAALQTIQAGIGETTLATLHTQPAQPSSTAWAEAFLTPLVNEIATIPDDFALVLDDYHVINTPSIHDSLTCLLDYLPPQMHLLLASRADPPLPLARLRARNQLLELRPAELRFTPDEAATFLNQVMGLNLSPADVATLETRTEGWIAGLQLAALSMQDCQDIPNFIASFTGSHRYILDYLAEEVLQRQPEHIQTFLLRTSILNRLTAPLCDAILSKGAEEQGDRGEEENSPQLPGPPPPQLPAPPASSQEILEYLEQANLFIIPLDDERRWYRYHHLFADFLRDYLQRQIGAQGMTRLHRHAAEWYEQNDLTAEAIGHALTVADVERAVRLVEKSGGTMLRQSDLSTLLNWLEALPEEVVRNRPRLSLFHAWGLIFTGQLEAVEARLQDAEFSLSPTSAEAPRPAEKGQGPVLSQVEGQEAPRPAEKGQGPVLNQVEGQTDILGEITTIRATVAYFQRDLPRAIELYCRAFEYLPEENLFLRGAVALSLATAYNIQGDIAGAKWAFEQASTISEANNNIYVTLIATWNLAQLHLEQAQPHRAEELYRRALDLAAQQVKQGQTLPPITGRVHVGLAEVLYQWNDLNAATHHLLEGIKFGQQSGDANTSMRGYLALARIKQARADLDGAFEMIGKAEAFAQKNNLPSWRVRLTNYRVWLGQDNLEAAARWAQENQPDLNGESADDSAGYPEELRQLAQLTRARLLIAQGKSDPSAQSLPEALELLTSLLQTAEETERTGRLLEILILQALAYQAQSNTTAAMATFEKALTLAEPEDYIRRFVDEGAPMAELLAQAAQRDFAPKYVDTLLAAFSAEKQQGDLSLLFVEPLSDRELELLGLIATGRSNKQIAAELVLTVGTVKWHLNNIYGKLGANSRTRAVAQARKLRLL